MLPAGRHPVHHAVAIFAGVVAFPVAVHGNTLDGASPIAAGDVSASRSDATLPEEEECLASAICAVKDRVRWRAPAWKPDFCRMIARAVLKSAGEHRVPPALILAVMINESDMNESAVRTTSRDGTVYAKDGGLMGIRCIVDKRGRCVNGNVRGLLWNDVIKPTNNIELGTRELARWREGGGRTTVTVRVHDARGKIVVRERNVPCQHKDHAYWAHYNHGPRYIAHGRARHYPHRIAVLYYALARMLDADTSEITRTKLTVVDPGKRPRTADRPIEVRYRKLCQAIRDVGPFCAGAQTASLEGGEAGN